MANHHFSRNHVLPYTANMHVKSIHYLTSNKYDSFLKRKKNHRTLVLFYLLCKYQCHRARNRSQFSSIFNFRLAFISLPYILSELGNKNILSVFHTIKYFFLFISSAFKTKPENRTFPSASISTHEE